MSEVKFKVGDLVYCPFVHCQIDKIVKIKDGKVVLAHTDFRAFINGLNANEMQSLWHATQENYERLSATFTNVEFEPPPKRKEPKEIIKAMLNNNYPFVLSSKENYALFLCDETNINEFNLDDYFIVSKETGQFIIDFVDGEVVLEGEK